MAMGMSCMGAEGAGPHYGCRSHGMRSHSVMFVAGLSNRCGSSCWQPLFVTEELVFEALPEVELAHWELEDEEQLSIVKGTVRLSKGVRRVVLPASC
jgi:hypothetical protein